MTIREQCVELINELPEEQLPYYAAFLRDVSRIYKKELEEELDEAYCLALYRESLEEEDEGTVPIEELAVKWGIDLNED